jgi:hypothetical protein
MQAGLVLSVEPIPMEPEHFTRRREGRLAKTNGAQNFSISIIAILQRSLGTILGHRDSAIRQLAACDESSRIAAARFESTVQIWNWDNA